MSSLSLWLLLIAVLVGVAYWQTRENQQLERRWQRDHNNRLANQLAHFAWVRTLHLLFALLCCILVIIAYDWQLRDARSNIDKLDAQVAQLQAQKAPPAAPVASAPSSTPMPTPAPLPANYYPPTTSGVFNTVPNTPIPAPAPSPTPQAAATPATDESVEAIYNPERGVGDNQSAMDDIKKRYEDILVTYMFLKKCKRVNLTDYRIITSALGQEMASVNAPGRMQYDILTAAQGSYKEMYSQSRCDGEGVDALYNQYNDYIRTLANDYPAQ